MTLRVVFASLFLIGHGSRHGTAHVGIHNYHEAAEFEKPWIKTSNILGAREVVAEKLKDESLTPEERKDAIASAWEMTNQVMLSITRMSCANLCAVCVPAADAFAESDQVPIKSILIERNKARFDTAVKLGLMVPNATAGATKGALQAFGAAVAAGVVGGTMGGVLVGSKVHNVTESKLASLVLGSLAGMSAGAVSTALTGLVSGLVLPPLQAMRGVGIVGKATQCGRVGFEAAVNGQGDQQKSFPNPAWRKSSGLKLLRRAMGYDRKWFAEEGFTSNLSAVVDANSAEAKQALDYNAISHCEYLRRHSFDVRHALECIKHSLLCGRKGALLFPIERQDTCAALSDSKQLESLASASPSMESVLDLWTATKERAQCIKLMCDYGGYKKGAFQTHPDRVDARTDISVEEKAKLHADLITMNTCRDKFKKDDGSPLDC